jgi:hypothetical protein
MKIDITASQPHYRDHMLPIFEALPERLRGTAHETESPCRPAHRGRIAMVAGWVDMRHLRNMNPMIYVEHGAGQAYLGDDKTATLPGYSGGGSRHSGVIGYICPSDTVAQRWAPTPAVAAGCPKMDRWIGVEPELGDNSVCFAWHWDAGHNTLSPEMRSAWDHYADALPGVVARWNAAGWHVAGHAHPRWEGALDQRMRDAGMIIAESDADVFRHVGHLFVDNSSLGYEFALLGRPVTWLNAPWYRRNVEHGLRFWSQVPGLQVSDPADLLTHLPSDLVGDREWADEIMAGVYSPWSHMGLAAERAAEWITELVDSRYS